MTTPCDNIQCPFANDCDNYLPWEPCTLPYEIGNESQCQYFKTKEGHRKKPVQTELFK